MAPRVKKLLAPLVLLVLCSAAPAQALSFDVSYSVSLHNADPGLVVWSDPLGGHLSFDLNAAGNSFSTETHDPLFTLGTDETALNLDDIIPSTGRDAWAGRLRSRCRAGERNVA